MNLPLRLTRCAFDADVLTFTVIHDATDPHFKVVSMIQIVKSRNKDVPCILAFIRDPRGEASDVFSPILLGSTCDHDGYWGKPFKDFLKVLHKQYLL